MIFTWFVKNKWNEFLIPTFLQVISSQVLVTTYLFSKKFDLPYTIIYQRGKSTGKILHTPSFLSPRFSLSRGDISPSTGQSIGKWPQFLLVCANYKHWNVFCIYQCVFKQTPSLCRPPRSTWPPVAISLVLDLVDMRWEKLLTLHIYTHIFHLGVGVEYLAFQTNEINMDKICNKLKYETLPIKYTADLFLACIHVKNRQNLTNMEDFQYTISNCKSHDKLLVSVWNIALFF